MDYFFHLPSYVPRASLKIEVAAPVMIYYAIQVRSSDEEGFIARSVKSLRDDPRRFFAPKRVLKEFKNGKTVRQTRTVFPGYVFLETEELDSEIRWKIRRVRGFLRFLNDTANPTPLNDRDRQLLLKFISFGKAADISKVVFDEQERIVVLDGPLKGLEGQIVKVDRRRGRAKVKLDMCETGFLVDFGFEAVAKAAKGGDSDNGGSGT